MALERELRSKNTNSLNYSIYNQMSQQQAGKGVNISHASFLSNHMQHTRYASRSPDERSAADNASFDPVTAVNMSGASHFYPSPISHGYSKHHAQYRDRASYGPPPPTTITAGDPEVTSLRRYDPPGQLTKNLYNPNAELAASPQTQPENSLDQVYPNQNIQSLTQHTPYSQQNSYIFPTNRDRSMDQYDLRQGNATMQVYPVQVIRTKSGRREKSKSKGR